MIDQLPYINIQELVDGGYLQEINRQFLHPLGLAMEVEIVDGVAIRITGIRDGRDDLEGIMFEAGQIDVEKFQKIKTEWVLRRISRVNALGWMTQPLPDNGEQSTV